MRATMHYLANTISTLSSSHSVSLSLSVQRQTRPAAVSTEQLMQNSAESCLPSQSRLWARMTPMINVAAKCFNTRPDNRIPHSGTDTTLAFVNITAVTAGTLGRSTVSAQASTPSTDGWCIRPGAQRTCYSCSYLPRYNQMS